MTPSTDLLELERAFQNICFKAEPPTEDLEKLHDENKKWMLYRNMVRTRLFQMARNGLPKSAEALGKERFDAAMVAYLDERPPKSRFIRNVVHELVEHASPKWEKDESLPAHFMELLRYEQAKWRVASMRVDEPIAIEFDFEKPAVFNPTLITQTIRFRVDKDSRELDDEHILCVYRNPDTDRIHTYVLNHIGGLLLRAWREQQSVAEGSRDVLRNLGRGDVPDQRFLDGISTILADLIEQKVIIGSAK